MEMTKNEMEIVDIEAVELTADTVITEEKKELSLELVKNTTPAVINFNYEELKTELDTVLGEYRNLVVTEQNLKGSKHAKKELASLRVRLDDFRKEVKKEAEKPIKAFEKDCNELLTLIKDAEKPLLEAINAFDEQTKEEKRAYARSLFDAAVSKYELVSPWSEQLQVLPEYGNLDISKKAIRESVDAQAASLKAKQDERKKQEEILENAVASENGRLKIQLKAETYISLLDNVDIVEILKKIKAAADDIFEQENPKPEPVVEPQPVTINEPFQSTPLSDMNVPMFENNLIPNLTGTMDAPVIPMLLPTEDMIAPSASVDAMPSLLGQMPFTEPSAPTVPMYKAVFSVTGDFETLRGLNEYMKQNGINKEIISQEKIS